MQKPVYLDYAATTPVDPRVARAMAGYLTAEGMFGNPHSLHPYGQAAKEAVEHAREQVANLIHAEPSEILWTSGATEANNLALKGVAQLYQKQGNHIITLKTEHASILDCCQALEKQGIAVTYLTPEPTGLISLSALKAAIRPETILISVMHLNNETGVIQDIEAIGILASQHNILFHVDAAQSVGKIPIDVNQYHIDLLSISAHKLYGPKGIGALYLRKRPRVRVAPQLHGGGHENGMRSGTLATHQIIGLGEACAIAYAEMQAEYKRLLQLREKIFTSLAQMPNIKMNGDEQKCFPGILNLQIQGVNAHDFIQRATDIAISTGSACGSKSTEPSYVLRAMGLTREQAASSIRVSFGRFTSHDDVEVLLNRLL